MLPRSNLRGRSLLAAGLVVCLAAALGAAPATASAQARPDLTATNGKVSLTAGTVTGRFTVRNIGRRAAPASTAYVQARVGAKYRKLTELRILRLAAGKSAKYAFKQAAPSWMKGTHQVRVCLDVKNRIREANERNNCLSLGKVTVSNAPPIDPGPINYTPDKKFLLGSKASGYYGWVPGGYDDSHATPSALFVWLHGCGGHSQYDIDTYHPAPAEEYVMIAPTGREGGCWSTPQSGAGDDALVLKWIRDVATRFNIDPGRIVLGGYSSGGDLSYRVAYRNSALIDGVLVSNSSPFRDTGLTSAQALAAATTKFRVVHLAHTGDTTYPIATVRSELQQLVDAGFPVEKIERPGTHYDEPGPGLPGTDADIRTYLLPKVDP